MDEFLQTPADTRGEARGPKMASTPSASGAPSTSTLDGIGEEIRTIAASTATKADLLLLTTTIQDALRAENGRNPDRSGSAGCPCSRPGALPRGPKCQTGFD
ncbi:Hypothetical predicted protein [Pelobates cultripes]|uniref:Uncharacterized protein n=1 Tax=Pelobates cultripes TaxID=61616 RepID=A0AAD1W3X8_PELCU|nr:Hypothetical predicted protein [Pelobates cultripes]